MDSKGAHRSNRGSPAGRTSRRHLLAMGGVVAISGLSGCLSRVASAATNTGSSPAAVFAGIDGNDDDTDVSFGAALTEPHVSRLTPTVSASSGPLSGDVALEAWVTAVAMENYNTPRSNRSAADPDDLDSDDDGVDADVGETALELERTLLSQTNEAAESISKRSARTGRNPETNDPITEHLEGMVDTIDAIRATLESCSDDVCATVREHADHREGLVRRAQGHVESGEWDDAAAAVGEVRDVVEGDVERLEDYNSPRSNRTIAAPDGVRTDDEADEIIRYFDDAPVVGERFTVCLPDAEVPGGNGSLAEEVTPRRLIDYVTGRAASDADGKVYAWGDNTRTASGNGGSDCDDRDIRIRPGDVCTPRHLDSAVSAPVATGGGLESSRTSDARVTVVNTPPQAEGGPSVLVCPVDGEAYEPSDLSEWGSESGASSETPTVVCQVWVQPPECPYPVPALLYAKRCRSDDQLVYTGGWVLDAAGVYGGAVTMLTVAGETQVIPVGIGALDGDVDGDGLGDAVERSVSAERARRGARVETGSVDALVASGVLSDGDDLLLRKRPGRAAEDGGGDLYCWGRDGSGSCVESDDVVVTHCPLDAPVLHLVDAGSASNEVTFTAGAELSKSVN